MAIEDESKKVAQLDEVQNALQHATRERVRLSLATVATPTPGRAPPRSNK